MVKGSARGFSLIEMLVALTITLVATSGVFTLMIPAHGTFSAQAEVSDMQQRLRVAADTLVRDLGRAGAGAYAGAAGGSLIISLAPVLPYRAGGADGDPPGTFRADTVTILSVPANSVEPVSATYWLKSDAAAGTDQLMFWDGSHADVPVADHIVGLTFDYYGDPQPPVMAKPLADPNGPWTTYGPTPLTTRTPSFAAGENCVFLNDGSPTPRPRLAVLGAAGTALVHLAPARLADGPWCPDETAANRWDADLLRVRRIVVTVRVEAAITALRGPAGALFAHGGMSRGGTAWAPDQAARFDVTPRNLNLGR
jgi:prepilin-type N-terminal cleavage/methylation domain-containing protein